MADGSVVVTGAAGFIGANLTARLLAEGFSVVGVDNLSYGSLDNLREAANHPAFRFVRADIRSVTDMEPVVRGASQIVHLAAYKIPRYSDALDTLLTNGLGSHVIFDLARKHRCRVIAASTSDVYGKSPDLPFREEGDLVLGNSYVKRWAYAVSKLFEEHLLLAYHERHNLAMAIVRFFGGYGPKMNMTWWGGPIPVFINAAQQRMPLPVHGDGSQTRSFTYVDDYVDPLVALLKRPEVDGRIFNIGSTEEVTLADLARRVWATIHDDEPKIQFIPYETFGRYEDCKRRRPDISLAAELLDYSPSVSLNDGLQRTVQWSRARRQGAAPAMLPQQSRRRTVHFLIPVYNEAPNLPQLVTSVVGAAQMLEGDCRLWFVDDGSTDETATVLGDLAQHHPIEVLKHPGNLGVAAAFNTGFGHLLGKIDTDDLVVTLEGDNTSAPEILTTMVARADQGADVVLASCYHHHGGIANVTWWRLLLSHCANSMMKVVFSLNAIATLSSFYRVYRARALVRVQEQFGTPLMVSKGYECMVELLAKLNYTGSVIEEVPMVLDGSRRRGRSKMKIVRTIAGYGVLVARRLFTRHFRVGPEAGSRP